MIRLLTVVLSFVLAAPACAEPSLALAQSQIRLMFAGQAAPVGVAAPQIQGGAAVEAPPYKGTDFTLKNTAGKELQLSAFQGQYVLLVFSATWCGPCKAAIPKFEALKAKYAEKKYGKAGGVSIISVYAEDKDTVAAHKKEKKATYEAVLDEGSAIGRKYLVRSYPTIFVITPDGTRKGPYMGGAGAAKAIKEIEAALGNP